MPQTRGSKREEAVALSSTKEVESKEIPTSIRDGTNSTKDSTGPTNPPGAAPGPTEDEPLSPTFKAMGGNGRKLDDSQDGSKKRKAQGPGAETTAVSALLGLPAGDEATDKQQKSSPASSEQTNKGGSDNEEKQEEEATKDSNPSASTSSKATKGKDTTGVATILGSFRFQHELKENPNLANALFKEKGDEKGSASQDRQQQQQVAAAHPSDAAQAPQQQKQAPNPVHVVIKPKLVPLHPGPKNSVEAMIKHQEAKRQRVKARNEARMASHPELQKNDVLLGRGSGVQNHPGNQNFRKLIKALKPTYMAARRNQKRTVCAQIIAAIEEMNPPGRFVVEQDNLYVEIPYQKAIEKTSQALREGAGREATPAHPIQPMLVGAPNMQNMMMAPAGDMQMTAMRPLGVGAGGQPLHTAVMPVASPIQFPQAPSPAKSTGQPSTPNKTGAPAVDV